MKLLIVLVFSILFLAKISEQNPVKKLDSKNSTETAQKSQLEANLTNSSSSLVCTQAIWRHGARMQLYTFPTDEHNPQLENLRVYGVKGLEQLTPVGIKSSFALGKYLRSRYAEFLSANYSIGEIYIVSSDTDRTIMTAMSVAQGLFPNQLDGIIWYPVPVKSIPTSEDNYISQLKPCKRNSELYNEYKNSSKFYTEKDLELYEYLTTHSGRPIMNFEQVYELQDTIFSIQRDLFGLPPPEWATAVEQQMLPLANNIFYGFVDSFEMMRFIVSPMLNRLVENFNCVSGNPNVNTKNKCKESKMYAFSGHDTTISPLLYLFQHYDINSPPSYNALLLFELHQQENQHYIRIFYRPTNTEKDFTAAPKELLLKACGGEVCEFRKFQEIYRKYLIDDATWMAECQNVETCFSPQDRR